MTDIKKAERCLMKATPKGAVIASSKLLTMVGHEQPRISSDTVRSAYWTLVTEGKLVRTPEGVRRSG